jgi:hypothetical protein
MATPAKYSDYLKQFVTKRGTLMFTETRVHFKLEERGAEKLKEVQDDYVIVTHRNVTRSFHQTLFSVIDT